MRVYHAGGSPHSASVRILLAEKGLDCAFSAIDLAGFENFGEDYLARNPAGQVPVLEDGDCRITQTFFILLYIDEKWPDPALGGSNPRVRYQVQKWGKYVETHIAPNLPIVRWSAQPEHANVPASQELMRVTRERRDLWRQAISGFSGDTVATARETLATATARLASELAGREWLAGPEFTLADIAVYPHAVLLAQAGVGIPPQVEDWLARMAERASVQEDRINECDLVTMGPERGRWG